MLGTAELLKMCVFGVGSIVCVVGGLAIASVLLLASLYMFVHAIDRIRGFYCMYRNVEVIYRAKGKDMKDA